MGFHPWGDSLGDYRNLLYRIGVHAAPPVGEDGYPAYGDPQFAEDWGAYIQSSEDLSLTQFGSLLEEHRPRGVVERSRGYAERALEGTKIDREKTRGLFSFLQMIGYYIERGQNETKILRKSGKKKGKPGPAKWAFPLMSRTSLSSIYSSILEPEEQAAHVEI